MTDTISPDPAAAEPMGSLEPAAEELPTPESMGAAEENSEPLSASGRSSEQLNAALKEVTQSKHELQKALEQSQARLSSAEGEPQALRAQCDDARSRLVSALEREKEMEAQVASMQLQLEQANKELEQSNLELVQANQELAKERKQWEEQYQVEKAAAEQVKDTLKEVQLEVLRRSQEAERERHEWAAKEKELLALLSSAKADAASEAAANSSHGADAPTEEGTTAGVEETATAPEEAAKDKEMVGGDVAPKPVPASPATSVNGEAEIQRSLPESPLPTPTESGSPISFLDGSATPEEAYKSGMQVFQEKWRRQAERMEELETEFRSKVASLEQERDELASEVELLQEDLRREQELAMEAGVVAEEEWRKRQEAERAMAELQREVAKQKKAARDALMLIPRAESVLSDPETEDAPALQGPTPSGSPALMPIASEADPGSFLLSPSHLQGQASPALGSFRPDFLGIGSPRAADEIPAGMDFAEAGEGSLPGLPLAGSVFSPRSPALGQEGAAAHGDQAPANGADGPMQQLGQEVEVLRKEVLELRLKLSELREYAAMLEEEKRELARKHAFGQVCLQLVTNAKDKFEDQIGMATRMALEASARGRESEKMLFALLADIGGLMKEHQVQAKNNGSTYNKYKITKGDIEIVKEDLRQLIKYVHMKAALAEKGRQKNRSKAAVDAARPRLAELKEGAAQEEDVLVELERELDEARRRAEEAEKMHSMVAAMREKERKVREDVEKELRAVQAKVQEAEIMKQQVEALKQTEQVLSRELAEEVKEAKVKTLEAEEVEGRISALEATENVIREELEIKTSRVRDIDRQFPRLMGLGLGNELPPPGLLGRKPQEELAWKEKRKVLEDLKVMREQLIWTQSSLLKTRQRLPELIQESKECKRRVEDKEKELRRVQQWLKEHDEKFAAARASIEVGDAKKGSTWASWGQNLFHSKKKDDSDGMRMSLGSLPMQRGHPATLVQHIPEEPNERGPRMGHGGESMRPGPERRLAPSVQHMEQQRQMLLRRNEYAAQPHPQQPHPAAPHLRSPQQPPHHDPASPQAGPGSLPPAPTSPEPAPSSPEPAPTPLQPAPAPHPQELPSPEQTASPQLQSPQLAMKSPVPAQFPAEDKARGSRAPSPSKDQAMGPTDSLGVQEVQIQDVPQMVVLPQHGLRQDVPAEPQGEPAPAAAPAPAPEPEPEREPEPEPASEVPQPSAD